MIRKLLQYSFDNKLAHIPSALSQFSYLKYVLNSLNNFKIVIGKPFGSQAYYLLWNEMGLLKNISNLSYGVKHDEIPFIEYSEETLGNALGIAGGIALTKKTYVNISDASLQMGPTLEAIQFIGSNYLPVLCTVDCNGMQLTGSTTDIMEQDIDHIYNIFDNCGWNVVIIDTLLLSEIELNQTIQKYISRVAPNSNPIALLFKTIKGQGVLEMEEDPVNWHYRYIKNQEELNALTIK